MFEVGQFTPVAHIADDMTLYFDGHAVPAHAGETVIAALLRNGARLGQSEFDGTPRAGFCLMGACQDCTLWMEGRGALRACMTEVRDGMRLTSISPLINLLSAPEPAEND